WCHGSFLCVQNQNRQSRKGIKIGTKIVASVTIGEVRIQVVCLKDGSGGTPPPSPRSFGRVKQVSISQSGNNSLNME
ncbi:hypothetical protein GW17_00044153, partial [Ensete ventricosum]